MPGQTVNGKAFEYACISEIKNYFDGLQKVEIINDRTFLKARDFFESLSNNEKERMSKAAKTAIRILARYEPLLSSHYSNEALLLSIQKDARGIHGDVRDVICRREGIDWSLGISCKHNHYAIKHSRLSKNLDFGKKWFDLPCSCSYFHDIEPIFNELQLLKSQHITWAEIENKELRFYVPLLNAFIKELNKIYYSNQDLIPAKLITYLLGRFDFYKVIAEESSQSTRIQAFNLQGTLNHHLKDKQYMLNVPHTKLPTRIIEVRIKTNSLTTAEIYLDQGWAISLRIHNASTIAEPSLKFDCTLIGIPQNTLISVEPWN